MSLISRTRTALVAALLVMVAAPAAAQAASSADLSLTSRGPARTPLVGEVFEITWSVLNSGPDSAPDASFFNYLGPELELISVTSSDSADACGADQPVVSNPEGEKPPEGGGGSGGPRGGGGAGCSLGTLAPGEGANIVFTLKRVSGRATYSGASANSSADDPNPENNYVEVYIEPDTSNPADVGVVLDGPRSPAVGSDFAFTATVKNNGPSSATGTALVVPVPEGVTVQGVESSRETDVCRIDEFEAGFSEVVCDLGPLAASSSAVIRIAAARSSAWEIWTSAWVQASNYDPNYENDYASHVIAADPSVTSDLRLHMRRPSATPLVGETFDLSLKVSNVGPAAAGDVWVSVYLPPELEVVEVGSAGDCSNHSGEQPGGGGPPSAAPEGDAYYPIGDGLSCSLGSLGAGASSVLEVTVTRRGAREMWSSGWVSSSNHDPDYENNYADLRIAPDKSNPADIALSMDAPARPEVDSDFDFTLAVTNLGPSRADAVRVVDPLPYGVDFVSAAADDPAARCSYEAGGPEPLEPEKDAPSFYGGGEVSCDFGSLASGDTATATITVTRRTDYEIWNSGWATTSNYDPDYDNDIASVLVEGRPYEGVCPADQGAARGSEAADSITVGGCDAGTGRGGDSITVVAGSEHRAATVAAGRGADTINVEITAAGDSRRWIQVLGGRGSDTIRISVAPGAGGGRIVVNGGSGNDLIEIDLPTGADISITAAGGGGRDRVVSISSSPRRTATIAGLTLLGGSGADLVQGGDGDDTLRGGSGRDRLFGALGRDQLFGGRGVDVCRGGPGREIMRSC